MTPATLILAAPGGFVFAIGTATRDAGLQWIGGVLTAVTILAITWMVKAVRRSMRADNERVTREVVTDVLTRELAPIRAQFTEVSKDIDQVAGEVARAHRRIDGVLSQH